MAHGDYACCAICDSKQHYVGFNNDFKAEICSSCLRSLHEEKIMVYTPEEFVKWAKAQTKKHLKIILTIIGFSDCWYENPVDKAVTRFLKPKKKVTNPTQK